VEGCVGGPEVAGEQGHHPDVGPAERRGLRSGRLVPRGGCTQQPVGRRQVPAEQRRLAEVLGGQRGHRRAIELPRGPRRLEQRHGFLPAAALTAVPFAAVHLPLPSPAT
jgi:hypothetical protein